MKMSQDKSLEEQFFNEASEVLRAFQPKMVQIWRQLGFPRGKQLERLNAAISHHKELWESMLEEEQNNKKKIVGSIDRLGRQYHQLCRELGTHFREFDSDAPLLEMEKSLQDALAELNREKEERMKVVRVLFEEEDKLRKRLGMEQFNINRERIPTNDQLSQLQQHLTFLRNEIVTRQEKYVTLRDAIRDAMQNLELSARSSFEVELFISEPQTVTLTDDDMERIKDFHQSLFSRLERNQKKAQELRINIETLWERLGVEAEIRDLYLMENRGHSPSTIASLERELARLEELKRQNIERFITAVRQDLLVWWDRCYVSETDRANFSPFKAEVFTEELLELHEAQVEKYKSLYNENKDIFAKVHHRQNLWSRMEDIEARGRDPSRLFGNRGCALLQEEKERKKIMKELPRVEAQLIDLFNQYERKNDHALLILGEDYRQTVEHQWRLRDNQKENEKLQRQKDRAEKLEAEAKGGAQPTTPMKRRLGTTAMRTAMESPKAKQRKLLPPSTAPQNRPARRILTEAMVNQLPGGAVPESHDHSTISTYSAFTEALTRKAKQDNCRSSTVLESPLLSKPILSSSTLPRRRSPRLAGPCLTPSTPVFKTRLLRRSKTDPAMGSPAASTTFRSSARVTPSKSTSKLALSRNLRPFLV